MSEISALDVHENLQLVIQIKYTFNGEVCMLAMMVGWKRENEAADRSGMQYWCMGSPKMSYLFPKIIEFN